MDRTTKLNPSLRGPFRGAVLESPARHVARRGRSPGKMVVHKRLYDHGWLCVRCGHTWVPETEASALTC
jgi:hypothetical protein